MKPLKTLTRLMRPGIAAAICLIAAWPVRAEDAGKDVPVAIRVDQPVKAVELMPPLLMAPAEAPKPLQVAPMPERVEPPIPGDPAEKELERENARLQKMEAELKALESLPLPSAPVPIAKVPVVKAPPDPNAIPKEPVRGLEEEYANSLYAVGKYDLARAAYQRIVDSKPKEDIMVWSRLQVANCARHSGDLQAAGAAYEALMTAAPASPWVGEAAWWAGEVKWLMLWDQSTK
jgi:tetratricopeptide (TPR) repeat protein